METDILLYLTLLFIISVFGLCNFSRLSYPFKILTIFILTALISETSVRISIIMEVNSVVVYHIFCLVNFWLFTLIYLALIPSRMFHQLLSISAILFTVVAIFNSNFIQLIWEIPFYNIALSNLLYVWMALNLFIRMLDFPTRTRLGSQSVFWMNVAVFSYAVVTPLSIGLMLYMITNERYAEIIMNFNEIVTVIYYGILGYAIYLDRQTKPTWII
jgi:hypothetical protein